MRSVLIAVPCFWALLPLAACAADTIAQPDGQLLQQRAQEHSQRSSDTALVCEQPLPGVRQPSCNAIGEPAQATKLLRDAQQGNAPVPAAASATSSSLAATNNTPSTMKNSSHNSSHNASSAGMHHRPSDTPLIKSATVNTSGGAEDPAGRRRHWLLNGNATTSQQVAPTSPELSSSGGRRVAVTSGQQAGRSLSARPLHYQGSLGMTQRADPCRKSRGLGVSSTEKVVIIGDGPSGLAAAIYAAQAQLCPIVIVPSVEPSAVHGSSSGSSLPSVLEGAAVLDMKQRARTLNVEIWSGAIASVNVSSSPLQIVTVERGTLSTHSLIFAMGRTRVLDIQGELEYQGYGVSSSAVRDALLHQSKPCAVVGGGNTAMLEALLLARTCSNVTLIHRGDKFRASVSLQQQVLSASSIEVLWKTRVTRFIGTAESAAASGKRRALTHLELQASDGSKTTLLAVSGAFVAVGLDLGTSLLSGQVAMDARAYIRVSERSTRTLVPGFFATGEVSDPAFRLRQGSSSGDSGTMAAMDAEHFLSESPNAQGSTWPRHEDLPDLELEEMRARVQLLGLSCVGCSATADYAAALQSFF